MTETALPPAQAGILRGSFVLLRLDNLHLLMPQADVGAAQYLSAPPAASGTPGVFERQDGAEGADNTANEAAAEDAPSAGALVLALSEQLQPLSVFPATRFLVAPLRTDHGELDFCWSEISVLMNQTLHEEPLPAALLAPDSPLRSFVQLPNGQLAFCCPATRLAECVLGALN